MEEQLTIENKANILEGLLITVKKDRPEFEEENTTGWDLLRNAEIWLKEVKSEIKKRAKAEDVSFDNIRLCQKKGCPNEALPFHRYCLDCYDEAYPLAKRQGTDSL
jgi:hypothetical protein